MRYPTIVTVALLSLSSGAVLAADRSLAAREPAAGKVDQALACIAVADTAARLACFDRTMAAVAEARARKEIYVVDKEEARSARRSLFGFNLPSLRLFGDRDGDGDPIREVSGTLASASAVQGGWLFRMQDGGRWRQIDDSVLGFVPTAGQPVVIRRGALTSYKLSIAGRPGLKVRREN